MSDFDTSVYGNDTGVVILTGGQPGPSGPPGPPVNVKGSVADFASLPSSGQVVNDVWITEDDGHARSWDGSTWADLGPFRGPAPDPQDVADEIAAQVAAFAEIGPDLGTVINVAGGVASIGALSTRLTANNVENTAAETTLGTSSVGTITPLQRFDLTVGGLITNNSGAPRTVTFRLKLGASVPLMLTTPSMAPTATARPFAIRASWACVDFLGTTLAGGGGTAVYGDGSGGQLGGSVDAGSLLASGVGAGPHSLVVTAQPSFAHADLKVAPSHAMMTRSRLA